jgi:hypothetical protein
MFSGAVSRAEYNTARIAERQSIHMLPQYVLPRNTRIAAGLLFTVID